MSHIKNIFSPPGTALEDRTVGEIVAERPTQSRVFQSFGIDFCCQGGKTLRDACEKKGVALETVVELLEAELRGKSAPEWNPADLPVGELAAYIVKTHHQYMKDEAPRLLAMATRVAQVHGGHTPSLVTVLEVFQHMEEEFQCHMATEEQVLFPAITRLAEGDDATASLGSTISDMLAEHNDAGADLEKLRELTDGFVPPPTACNTYRALFAGLAELETDLHRHIHLENAVLFPSALALAAK